MNEPSEGDKVYEEGGPYYGRFDEFVRDNKKRVAELNELFVKTVRATGGNNEQRVLSVSPMKQFQLEYFEDFTPPADDRLIVQAHYYFNSDGTPYTSWKIDNPADTKKIDEDFEILRRFKDRTGLPVIVGEWGNAESLPISDRIDQAKYILIKAKDLGIPAFWWESTIQYETDPMRDRWSLYNRKTNMWTHPELIEAIYSVVF